MIEKTIFPREEKAEVLFDKILSDKWAYNKLFQTFCDNLFCNDDSGTDLSPLQFTEALFNCYTNKDLSAFLMAISQNTLFDLLRNSFLIPYRFNAYNIYQNLHNNKNIFLAKAYRYSHIYGDDPSIIEQQIIEENTGILLIRELPDTVKLKETEAEAYSAVWDLMLELEKNLPMAYIFYGQDSYIDNNKHFDELGIFLPNSIFLKNLENHVKKAEEIIYAKD